jgi:hypothetical protein
MKIEILGQCRWAINFKGVDFVAGQICDVPFDVPVDVANDMIRNKHAREYVEKQTAENKQVVYGQEVNNVAKEPIVPPETKKKAKK